MLDSFEAENNGERSAITPQDYLMQANEARVSENAGLAMSLYLAAFDCSEKEPGTPNEDCINGLKTAWVIACSTKRRTLAEYIFERLEPYLSHQEIETYAERLQELAMDKLEEFGMSRTDLEDMIDSIPQELAGFDVMSNLHDSFSSEEETPAQPLFPTIDLGAMVFPSPEQVAAFSEEASARGMDFLDVPLKGPADDESDSCDCGGECACGHGSKHQEDQPQDVQPAFPFMGPGGMNPFPFFPPFMGGMFGAPQQMPQPAAKQEEIEALSFADMAGYERTIDEMRSLGIGVRGDAAFEEFIAMLNEKHGLHGMPAVDTLLFRSPAREDAGRFMEATFGELRLPGIRMHVEENAAGALVLCVMAQTNTGLKLNAARNEIEGAGVLLLEDIDLWAHLIPAEDESKDSQNRLSRGAREALRLIRSAVENPDAYVLASCASDGEVDPFFLDLLEPISVVDIDLPTESERRSLWNDLIRRHPSLEGIDVEELVAFSKKLPRFDIMSATREAVDATYKASLVSRKYEPVSMSVLFEKLAAYQPLDSTEYKKLEEAVIDDFRAALDELDDFFNIDDILMDDVSGLGTENASLG